MKVVTPVQILHGIAAGVFGKSIIGSETVMALIGLLFHFIIACIFAAVYFLRYKYVSFLHRNTIISGLLYGVIVWLIMNLVAVPLSNAYHAAFSWVPALRDILILMLCVGLPISLFTARYYKRKEAV